MNFYYLKWVIRALNVNVIKILKHFDLVHLVIHIYKNIIFWVIYYDIKDSVPFIYQIYILTFESLITKHWISYCQWKQEAFFKGGLLVCIIASMSVSNESRLISKKNKNIFELQNGCIAIYVVDKILYEWVFRNHL